MAKKREKFDSKKVRVNEEELAITKIGELITAEQNPFFIFLVFGCLLLFIFFLPTLVHYFNKEEEKPDYSLPNTQDKINNSNTLENQEDAMYELHNTLSISLEEDITIKNFRFENTTFIFTVINNGSNRFSFNQKNYFLEMYTENNTLLERIILVKDTIPKEASVDFSYPIMQNTATNTKKIRFVEKAIADYPNITLNKTEAEEQLLVCENEVETLSYHFKEDKLEAINDVINYSNQNTNYNVKLEEWKNKVSFYNNTHGVSSTFIETGNSFIVNTIIDLKTTNINTLSNAHYYRLDTEPKVVNFEMESRGFRCK